MPWQSIIASLCRSSPCRNQSDTVPTLARELDQQIDGRVCHPSQMRKFAEPPPPKLPQERNIRNRERQPKTDRVSRRRTFGATLFVTRQTRNLLQPFWPKGDLEQGVVDLSKVQSKSTPWPHLSRAMYDKSGRMVFDKRDARRGTSPTKAKPSYTNALIPGLKGEPSTPHPERTLSSSHLFRNMLQKARYQIRTMTIQSAATCRSSANEQSENPSTRTQHVGASTKCAYMTLSSDTCARANTSSLGVK